MCDLGRLLPSDSPGRFWEHLSFIKYLWNISSIAKWRSNMDYKQTVLLICLVELIFYNYLQVIKKFGAIIFRSFLDITQYLIKTHIVKNIDGKLLETLCHMFVVERVTRVLRQEILSSPSISFHHLSCTQAHGVLGPGWLEAKAGYTLAKLQNHRLLHTIWQVVAPPNTLYLVHVIWETADWQHFKRRGKGARSPYFPYRPIRFLPDHWNRLLTARVFLALQGDTWHRGNAAQLWENHWHCNSWIFAHKGS